MISKFTYVLYGGHHTVLHTVSYSPRFSRHFRRRPVSYFAHTQAHAYSPIAYASLMWKWQSEAGCTKIKKESGRGAGQHLPTPSPLFHKYLLQSLYYTTFVQFAPTFAFAFSRPTICFLLRTTAGATRLIFCLMITLFSTFSVALDTDLMRLS